MSADINLNDDEYANLISIFFVGYILCEIPSNMILAKLPRPSYYVPTIMLIWGSVLCAMSQVQNYAGIMACRFFLGCFEAGLVPGVLFIMTTWYKKAEIGKRFCFFWSALCVAGALSGLLAGAIIGSLEGARGMEGWRWLFLIEGIMTVGTAIIVKFILLEYPWTSTRLSLDERQLATIRLIHDRKQTQSQGGKKLTPWQGFCAAFKDYRTYIFIVLYQLTNASSSVNYFVPTIVKGMGYTGAMVQWMTVPIWAVATVFLLVGPQLSDRYRNRQRFIMIGLILAFISCIICLTVKGNVVRYVCLCFFISGIYMATPLVLNWASETILLPAEKRAVIIAGVNSIGCFSSIYGSRLWPSSDAPQYLTGFITVACFSSIGTLLALGMPLLFRKVQARPTKAEAEALAEILEINGPSRDEKKIEVSQV